MEDKKVYIKPCMNVEDVEVGVVLAISNVEVDNDAKDNMFGDVKPRSDDEGKFGSLW